MKIIEAINRIDSLKPNQYGVKTKITWLSYLDGEIRRTVIDTHEGRPTTAFSNYTENDIDKELVVEPPFDELYVTYLSMKIDEANCEATRYNNSAMMLNTQMQNFRIDYNRTHMPIQQGFRCRRPIPHDVPCDYEVPLSPPPVPSIPIAGESFGMIKVDPQDEYLSMDNGGFLRVDAEKIKEETLADLPEGGGSGSGDGYTKAETDALLEDKADKILTYTKQEVDALIPSVPIKGIKANGESLTPNASGVVDIDTKDLLICTIRKQGDDWNIDKEESDIDEAFSEGKLVVADIYEGSYVTRVPFNGYAFVRISDDGANTVVEWWSIITNTMVDPFTGDETYDGITIDYVTRTIPQSSGSIDAYTKSETDTLLSGKADKSTTYTKPEVDSALSGKADASSVYTKQEVDALIPSLTGYATETFVINAIQEAIRGLTPLPTKTLSSISATKTKTSYDVGEQFSTADVTVTASYSDSTSADVTSSATIGTVDTSTSGNKSLSISYAEDGVTKTTTISITVVASIISDPVVPQTGTWQYKSTPTKGYIIIGKDDDTSDQAQFVRMVSGYGYPVTINTTYASKDNVLVSDADTANSTYPAGSESTYPNGTTVEALNKHIIDDELGEVAQHDMSAKSIWDSTNIDDYMDGMYATYTAGGGTKTKAELKTAILEKYADTDVAQGANRIDAQRALLKASLEYPIYTLGEWGASGDTIVIDDITLGNLHDNMRSSTTVVAREKNYMADGILSHSNNSMPFKIFRNSEGLSNAVNAASMCEMAQSELSAIEVFCHLYIHNDSATDWGNLKGALDAIKSAVDAGKVEVVTRKQFAELGEYVEHPITALSFSPKELSYDVGTTLSASDFNCNAILDDLSTVACASDKVVDLSQVNTSTAGTYTATLYYRGKKQTCSVTISSEPTPEYILANKSYSGASGSEGYNLASETLSVEAGKTYRFDFDFTAETSVRYSTHYIALGASKQNGVEPRHWSANTATINTTEGTTTSHVVVDMAADATRTVAELFKWSAILNTTVGAWSITNLYCWEVTE